MNLKRSLARGVVSRCGEAELSQAYLLRCEYRLPSLFLLQERVGQSFLNDVVRYESGCSRRERMR